MTGKHHDLRLYVTGMDGQWRLSVAGFRRDYLTLPSLSLCRLQRGNRDARHEQPRNFLSRSVPDSLILRYRKPLLHQQRQASSKMVGPSTVHVQLLSGVLSLFLLSLLLGSLAEAGGVSQLRGACLKAHRSIHFTVPGYMVQALHVNECRESVTSAIYPVVSLNPSEVHLFRRQYASCCCAIGSTSMHEAELQSFDGRPPLALEYRRIEECVCVDCADLAADRRVTLQRSEEEEPL